jgi:hypothetical protein
LSENEPINKLSLKNDFVNNYVQAKFIAIRRILQGREDLIINLQTDYSGIQVEAGDVIRITNETYGWTDKLFRISNVIEEKDADGNLFAKLTGFEYNATIYDDDLDITDFIPADNTGLQDPNIIAVPDTPIVIANVDTTLNFLDVSANVPNVGLIINLDFNYGFDSNTANHLYYTTVNYSNGAPLIPDSTYSINVNDIEQSGNIFWSTTARNRQVGIQSLSSAAVLWPGANVSVYDPGSNTGGITGNNIANGSIGPDKLNFTPNGIIVQNDGSNVANAAIGLDFVGGGVTASVGTGNIANIYITGYYQSLGSATFEIANVGANTVTLPVDVTGTSTRNIPVFIPGTDPGANYYYPYAQGTSTTANYYAANSSASFQPATASVLLIDDGDDNWYRILQANTSRTIPAGETLIFNYYLQLLSDTDNTVVQIAYGMRPVSQTYDVVYTPLMTTLKLDSDLPVFHDVVRNTQVVGSGNSDAGGVWIRNLTNSSNVYVVTGQLILRTAN